MYMNLGQRITNNNNSNFTASSSFLPEISSPSDSKNNGESTIINNDMLFGSSKNTGPNAPNPSASSVCSSNPPALSLPSENSSTIIAGKQLTQVDDFNNPKYNPWSDRVKNNNNIPFSRMSNNFLGVNKPASNSSGGHESSSNTTKSAAATGTVNSTSRNSAQITTEVKNLNGKDTIVLPDLSVARPPPGFSDKSATMAQSFATAVAVGKHGQQQQQHQQQQGSLDFSQRSHQLPQGNNSLHNHLYHVGNTVEQQQHQQQHFHTTPNHHHNHIPENKQFLHPDHLNSSSAANKSYYKHSNQNNSRVIQSHNEVSQILHGRVSPIHQLNINNNNNTALGSQNHRGMHLHGHNLQNTNYNSNNQSNNNNNTNHNNNLQSNQHNLQSNQHYDMDSITTRASRDVPSTIYLHQGDGHEEEDTVTVLTPCADSVTTTPGVMVTEQGIPSRQHEYGTGVVTSTDLDVDTGGMKCSPNREGDKNETKEMSPIDNNNTKKSKPRRQKKKQKKKPPSNATKEDRNLKGASKNLQPNETYSNVKSLNDAPNQDLNCHQTSSEGAQAQYSKSGKVELTPGNKGNEDDRKETKANTSSIPVSRQPQKVSPSKTKDEHKEQYFIEEGDGTASIPGALASSASTVFCGRQGSSKNKNERSIVEKDASKQPKNGKAPDKQQVDKSVAEKEGTSSHVSESNNHRRRTPRRNNSRTTTTPSGQSHIQSAPKPSGPPPEPLSSVILRIFRKVANMVYDAAPIIAAQIKTSVISLLQSCVHFLPQRERFWFLLPLFCIFLDFVFLAASIVTQVIGKIVYSLILLHKLAVLEILDCNSATLCYSISFFYPSFVMTLTTLFPMLPYGSTLVGWYAILRCFFRPIVMEETYMYHIQALERKKDEQLIAAQAAQGGEDGERARGQLARIMLEKSFKKTQQNIQELKDGSKGDDADTNDFQDVMPESVRVQMANQFLYVFRKLTPILLLIEGATRGKGFIMTMSISERMLLGYGCTVVRCGYIFAPLVWLCWSIQLSVILCCQPSIFVCYFLMVLGLSSVRLTHYTASVEDLKESDEEKNT